MDDLIIADNHQHNLAPGMHKFSTLQMGENSSIMFSGTVSILVKKLIAPIGCKIEYISPTSPSPIDTLFTLHAIDASGVKNLTFFGDGYSPDGFQPGDRGPDGSAGSDAGGVSWTYPGGSNSTGGGNAPSPAATGPSGQNAASFSVYLPFLNPGSELNFSTIGGNGGRGQDGGNGGRGGRGNTLKGPSGGGDAADGGTGGNGGNAGKVGIFLVVPEDKTIDKNSVIESVSINLNVAGGNAGAGGEPGLNGAGGDTNYGPTMPPGHAGNKGSRGMAGKPGNDARTEPDANWIDVDVMDFETYKAYIAQIVDQYE
ncbi:UNVERIFIED_ORG: hypothetical protein J2W65_002455 [Pseudomonas parafulva]|nr:hypothetical protein [Pseudomonas parafulva]